MYICGEYVDAHVLVPFWNRHTFDVGVRSKRHLQYPNELNPQKRSGLGCSADGQRTDGCRSTPEPVRLKAVQSHRDFDAVISNGSVLSIRPNTDGFDCAGTRSESRRTKSMDRAGVPEACSTASWRRARIMGSSPTRVRKQAKARVARE